MRLSEKTFELNFCSQFAQLLGQYDVKWFGLTQRQEAKAGFDACTRTNGNLFLFQFKVSNRILNGVRRFKAPHRQLQNLRQKCRAFGRRVFYVLPMIGTTLDFFQHPNILTKTWFLDVSRIPWLFSPSRGNLKPYHYIDVPIRTIPPIAIIHSKPIKISLLNTEGFIKEVIEEFAESKNLYFGKDYKEFEKMRRLFKRNSIGGIITKKEVL